MDSHPLQQEVRTRTGHFLVTGVGNGNTTSGAHQNPAVVLENTHLDR